jgi:hypothetical protein
MNVKKNIMKDYQSKTTNIFRKTMPSHRSEFTSDKFSFVEDTENFLKGMVS